MGNASSFRYTGIMERVRTFVLLAVIVALASCVWCLYIKPPAELPAPSPVASSPGVKQPPSAAPSAAPQPPARTPPAPPAPADSADLADPGVPPELPIDPSQPMPERSLSTDGALERDKRARFLVDGRADIYSAGLAVADPERRGVLPAKITLAEGAGVLRFLRVAGKAGCIQDAAYGPDGGDCAGGDTSLEPAGGISGVIAHERTLFLVGVFLAGRAPEAPPPTLDFSASARGVAFTELAPQLAQVFFIGDGLAGTASGDTQRFLVPSGATHLYLGYADGAGFQGVPGWYGDNTGGVDATVVQRAQ